MGWANIFTLKVVNMNHFLSHEPFTWSYKLIIVDIKSFCLCNFIYPSHVDKIF